MRVAKLPMSAVLRTRTIDELQGFMKALVGADDDRILGFAMIGAEAGEVAAAVQMVLAGLPYTGLRDAILTHPTMAEDSARSSRMCRPGPCNRLAMNKGRRPPQRVRHRLNMGKELNDGHDYH